MVTQDRRSGAERRVVPRKKVTVDVEWELDGVRSPGTISDISEAGCFVLCSGEVEDGDLVVVYLPIDAGMKVQILGEVRNHLIEIGFALRFTALTEAQHHVVNDLIKSYSEDSN